MVTTFGRMFILFTMIILPRTDMWKITADAHCVLTNGVVKGNGRLVMGAGVAKQALLKFSNCDMYFGQAVKTTGNNVYFYAPLQKDPVVNRLVSFPTKHHWSEKSDLGLIEKSADQLLKLVNDQKWNKIVIPTPGIGLGGLKWSQVQPVLEESWGADERFCVVSTEDVSL